MKLRNKKTGEIFDGDVFSFGDINSLAELNAEWEDYEEPKEYYFINELGTVGKAPTYCFADEKECRKSIGNYFKTKEEAEKAVERLRAWKRLQDKGFRFTGINDDEDSQELITQCGILCEADIYHLEKDADFLLLFGGKE